jgi:hypothetical protein
MLGRRFVIEPLREIAGDLPFDVSDGPPGEDQRVTRIGPLTG